MLHFIVLLDCNIIMFQTQADLGDVLFSLKFLPTGDRLMVITVILMKARNLETVMPKGKLGENTQCDIDAND